jgi:hypothetical protein
MSAAGRVVTDQSAPESKATISGSPDRPPINHTHAWIFWRHGVAFLPETVQGEEWEAQAGGGSSGALLAGLELRIIAM